MVPDDIRHVLTEVLGENDRLRGEVALLKRRLDEVLQLLEAARRAGKRQAAPFSRGEPKQAPKKPGRRAGAEYGKAAHREPPDHVDETIAVELPEYCECGGCIEREGTAEQFQEEVPVPEPIVIRFEIAIGRCQGCGQRVQGHDPRQPSDAVGAAGAQLGPRAQAMASVLMKRLGLSAAKASESDAADDRDHGHAWGTGAGGAAPR